MRPGKKHTGLEGRSEVATENARPEKKQKKHFGFEGRAPKMRDQKKHSLAFTGGRKKMRDQKKHAFIQGLPPAIRHQKTLGGNLGRSRAWVRKNTPAFSNVANENRRPEKSLRH